MQRQEENKMKKKYKSNVFGDMSKASIGLATASIPIAVGAGVAAQAPAGTPNLMGGFTAMSSMAGVATTAYIGGSILKSLKKKKY